MKNLAKQFNPKILKYLMKNSGETVQTLAKKSGVSVATIWRMREGKHVPSWPTLEAMAVVFDIEPICFCAEEEEDKNGGVRLNHKGVVMNFEPAYLRALREESGLTIRELGIKTGVSKDSILKYEHGNAKPLINTLRKLAGFFKVAPDYFCDDVRDSLAVDSMFEEMEEKREILARFIKYSY